MTAGCWGHLPSPPFSTQSCFFSSHVLYFGIRSHDSLWVWSQRWGLPCLPGPHLPFSPHSAVHPGIVILPRKHLLHRPPPSTPVLGWTPMATGSLLAPGSPASPSSCSPVITQCLEPSAAPCCAARNWLVAWPRQPCQPHSLPASPVPSSRRSSRQRPGLACIVLPPSFCINCFPHVHALTPSPFPLETKLRDCALREAVSYTWEEPGASPRVLQTPGPPWVRASAGHCTASA